MKTFQDLIELARILRAPGGCPWDQEQTLQTTKDYVIEEAFELIDAIEAGKIQDQVEEIGDLLFQIAFMIVLLEEEEPESVAMLIHKIYDKLIYRHPHVFDKQGDKNILSTKQVLQQWETLKNKEANKQQRKSSLDKIPLSYPSLMRAHQVLKIFNKKGFNYAQHVDKDSPGAKILESIETLIAQNKEPELDFKMSLQQLEENFRQWERVESIT